MNHHFNFHTFPPIPGRQLFLVGCHASVGSCAAAPVCAVNRKATHNHLWWAFTRYEQIQATGSLLNTMNHWRFLISVLTHKQNSIVDQKPKGGRFLAIWRPFYSPPHTAVFTLCLVCSTLVSLFQELTNWLVFLSEKSHDHNSCSIAFKSSHWIEMLLSLSRFKLCLIRLRMQKAKHTGSVKYHTSLPLFDMAGLISCIISYRKNCLSYALSQLFLKKYMACFIECNTPQVLRMQYVASLTNNIWTIYHKSMAMEPNHSTWHYMLWQKSFVVMLCCC